MLLNKIALKNIGPHKETEINFANFGSIVAITGNNGAGKTFLMEAIPALFYGMFPTRPGSIYDRVTKGHKGEASIEVEFEMNGQFFAARRVLKAGLKRPTAEAIIHSFEVEGAMPTFLAGPKIDDFEKAIENLVGDRGTFLASIYSSQQNTGDLCDAKPAERKAIFAKMLGLERLDQVSELAKEKAQELHIEEDVNVIEMGNLQAEVKQLQAGADELPKLVDREEEVRLQVKVLTEEIELRQGKLNKLSAAIEIAKQKDQQISTLDSEIKQLSAQNIKKVDELDRLRFLIEDAKTIHSAAEELKELSRAESEFAEKKSALLSYNAELATLKGQISTAERALILVKQQAELIKDIPDQSCCRSCKLASKAYEAKDTIAPTLAELDPLKAALAGMKQPEYNASRHQDIKQRIGELYGAEKKLGELESAQASYAPLKETVQDFFKAIEEKCNLRQQLINEREEYKNAVTRQTQLTMDIGQAKSMLASEQEKLSGLNQQIGKCKQQLAMILEKEKQLDKLGDKIFVARAKIKIYEILNRAFGKNGIQPLIIDSARPRFENIANEMLETATDGRMQIRFDTQRTLKTGDVAESMDIIITRDGFEQDIAEFSGGEQKLLKTIIRLTLSIYQATHSGRRLRTIFIDEVFDNLDYDNSERLLKVLGKLQDYFDKIILVSHNDELLQALPSRLNLKKNGSGVDVETIV